MKTILLATSLSDNSSWASDYALDLATKLDTELVIVHAYDPNPPGSLEYESEESAATVQHYLATRRLGRLRTHMMTLTKGSVTVSIVARPGDPETVIETEAATWNADLLIMGLADKHPPKARSEGSLAIKLIPRTKVPMLLIPAGVRYHTVKTILLAVDLSSPVSVTSLASTKGFIQLFGAMLDIICMEDEPDDRQRKAADGLGRLLADLPHTFRFIPGNDLTMVLDHYLTHHDVDLIMLLPKPHSRLATALLESVTQQVVRQTMRPVLATV